MNAKSLIAGFLIALSASSGHSADSGQHTTHQTEAHNSALPTLPESYPDDRQSVDQTQYPWRAIGSISIAGRQFCTATLISENQVVTAAHCLWNPIRNNWYPAEHIHFLAGYDRGDYLAHSTAKHVLINPKYRPQDPLKLSTMQEDWALLTLHKKVGTTLGFIPVRHQPLEHNAPLFLAGYRQDRPELLSVSKSCAQQQHRKFSQQFLVHHCATTSGDSGGPLLSAIQKGDQAFKQGDVFLEGIHVGRASTEGNNGIAHTYSLAIPTERFINTANLIGGSNKRADLP